MDTVRILLLLNLIMKENINPVTLLTKREGARIESILFKACSLSNKEISL